MDTQVSEPKPANFEPVSPCEAKRPGRPRCPAVENAIKEATRELIEEVGFGGLTIEGVAHRAGVGKATIYRWWTNKASLVMDSVLCQGFMDTEAKLDGPVAQALREHLMRLVTAFSGPRGRLISALIAGAQSDPDLAEAFRCRWMGMRREVAIEVLYRGIDSGDLRQGICPEVLLDSLYGALFFRLLIDGRPIDERFLDMLLSIVLSESPVLTQSPEFPII